MGWGTELEVQKQEKLRGRRDNHLLHTLSSPTCIQQWLLWKDYPQVLLLSITLCGMEYPFSQFRSAVLAMPAPRLLPTQSLLATGARKIKFYAVQAVFRLLGVLTLVF